MSFNNNNKPFVRDSGAGDVSSRSTGYKGNNYSPNYSRSNDSRSSERSGGEYRKREANCFTCEETGVLYNMHSNVRNAQGSGNEEHIAGANAFNFRGMSRSFFLGKWLDDRKCYLGRSVDFLNKMDPSMIDFGEKTLRQEIAIGAESGRSTYNLEVEACYYQRAREDRKLQLKAHEAFIDKTLKEFSSYDADYQDALTLLLESDPIARRKAGLSVNRHSTPFKSRVPLAVTPVIIEDDDDDADMN